jgi:Autographiviridae endonuclease I
VVIHFVVVALAPLAAHAAVTNPALQRADNYSVRNAFEQRCGAKLGPDFQYEAVKLSYQPPAKSYTPDWINPDTKEIVEAKGYLRPTDRAKMLLVKRDNPGFTYRIIFQNPHRTISKQSRTTYAQWAEKHGFKWEEGPKR